MAAIAIAAGMARVAQIASQQPGGGASVSAGGGVGTPSLATVGSTAPAQPAVPASPVVNVHIYGNVVDHDAFAREIVPYITKAVADGVR
jgi:hypothetical protein